MPRHLDTQSIERIKRLDVRARAVVEGFLTGQHQSPYHGFAVEFASHREYAPGDEIKHIDWKVWSRTDRLYVKEYEEETNLSCTILLDASKSMRYGSATDPAWSKFDLGATAAASLAFLLQQQQDAVGLLTFSNQVDLRIAPGANAGHFRRLVHELEQVEPDRNSDLSPILPELARSLRKRGLVVLVSDLFFDPDDLRDALRQFRLRRHDVVVFHTLHRDELEFPFERMTLFRGLEAAAELQAEPSTLRKSYLQIMDDWRSDIRRQCSAVGADYILLKTGEPLDAALARYLAVRARSRRST